MARRKKRRRQRSGVILAVLVIGGIAWWAITSRDATAPPAEEFSQPTAEEPQPNQTQPRAQTVSTVRTEADVQPPQQPQAAPEPAREAVASAAPPAQTTRTPQPDVLNGVPLPQWPDLSPDEAMQAYEEGLSLYEQRELIPARNALSTAVLSGTLPAEQARQARTILEALARQTLFSRVPLADDPYTDWYEVQPGQVLAGRNGIVRQLELRVPEQIIVEINGLRRAQDIQAFKKYKMLKGPFHAIVHKDEFVMDIVLQRGDLPPVYVTRLPVGLGVEGSTPVGLWHVERSGKEVQPTWYPPPASPIQGPIPFGHPDYAFGDKGLWISLEGLDANTAGLTSYGIHSTDKPDTVGTNASLGCIRLRDDDIQRVFDLLYPVWSVVDVRP